MLSSEKRISVSLENWTRIPPAALLVVPEPTVSRSRTTTSCSPRRARGEAIEEPTTPPPMMTALAVPGRGMRPDYDEGVAGPAQNGGPTPPGVGTGGFPRNFRGLPRILSPGLGWRAP